MIHRVANERCLGEPTPCEKPTTPKSKTGSVYHPREFVKDAAGANVKWRTFDPWSHLLTLVIVQPSRQESLNGICDVAKALAYEWDSAGLELPLTRSQNYKLRHTLMHSMGCY